MFLNASWVPEVVARPWVLIVPLIGDPGTVDQLVIVGLLLKMLLTVDWLMVGIVLPCG